MRETYEQAMARLAEWNDASHVHLNAEEEAEEEAEDERRRDLQEAMYWEGSYWGSRSPVLMCQIEDENRADCYPRF